MEAAMPDDDRCPGCGGTRVDSVEETDERTALYCSDCGYRLYPPEDRNEHLERAKWYRRPAKDAIRVEFDKDR
jgi:transcription elongation factor Elf1